METQSKLAAVPLSPARRSISLNGEWQLTYGPIKSIEDIDLDPSQPPAAFTTIPATVPGNVELDMVAAGRLADPTVGSRSLDWIKLEFNQWWYKRTFVTPKLEAGEKANLIFEGLDCIATVWVNGKLAGRAANMAIPHQFEVTKLLRPTDGENEILIRIDPATAVGRVQHFPGECHYAGHWEHLTIRKPQMQYGFESPRIVTAGLWQDVRLELTRPTHLRSVYWTTRTMALEKRSAGLKVDWDFATDRVDLRSLKVRAILSREGKVIFEKEYPVESTHDQQVLDNIENVNFWWPRGFGDHPLYDAMISILDENGQVIDERKDRIGIRTIALNRTDTFSPSEPGNFCFVVNGQKIFIKGTNWCSFGAFHSRDAKQLEEYFPLLVAQNCNMIRRNGADVYGSDRFYDLCDENGVLVWQDFMLGNERVPQTDEFRKIMDEEASSVITRLRNHPSLALWCGGNEFDYDYWVRDFMDPNTDTISRRVFPEAIQQLDPYRSKAYLPCTPCIGPGLIAKGGDLKLLPDVHMYQSKPPFSFKSPFYTSEVTAPFCSEIGFISIPCRASLEQMLSSDRVNPRLPNGNWNPEWIVKAGQVFPWQDVSGRLNDMVRDYNIIFSDVSDNLDDMILASQAHQAEALKFEIDSWRIHKGQRWGILLFQFTDGWPTVSWGVVDYYNRKKLAYDYILEAQRDVQAICGEAEKGQHPVVIVNDTFQPVQGSVTVKRLGETTPLFDTKFNVEANGKANVGEIPQPKESEMWVLEWNLQDGRQFKTHYLSTQIKVPLRKYKAWLKQLGLSSESKE